jgi:hypothetical protein
VPPPAHASQDGAPVSPAARIATEFVEACVRDVAAAYNVLAGALSDRVEIRHDPPVKALDGWRSATSAAQYLRLEAVSMPRAFQDGAVLQARATWSEDEIVFDPFSWVGALRDEQLHNVVISYRVAITLRAGRIVRITGSPLPTTNRSHLRAWLRALDDNGGFTPPPSDLTESGVPRS